MPTATVLFFLPLSGNVTPTASLVSNITMKPACSPLPAYEVTHHLYANTSSLLPANAKPAPREFHQLLTAPQDRSKTYIGITRPLSKGGKAETTTITIPTSQRDQYMQLHAIKFQPLWAHRQSLFVERGRSVSIGDSRYILRLGDLRMTGKNKSESTVRGVLLEFNCLNCDGELGTNMTDEDPNMKLLRALFNQLGQEVNIQVDSVRALGRYTEDINEDAEKKLVSYTKLAELYMEFFRNLRG